MAELTFNEIMDPHTWSIAPAGAAVHIAIGPDRDGTVLLDAYYTPEEARQLAEAILQATTAAGFRPNTGA